MFRYTFTGFNENKISILKVTASGKLLSVTRNLFGRNDEISIGKAQCPTRILQIIVKGSARNRGINT
jgi:hypothetical protein